MKLIDILRLITKRENLQLYDNSAYIQMWADWYKGKVAKFHNYRIFNGKRHIKAERFSLGMAKKVCEDWANLLVNEKTDITLGDEKSQTVLSDVLKKCHFWRKANEGIEKTFALGGGAWVVSVENLAVAEDGTLADKNYAKVNVSFVNAQKMRPITIEDGEITECAFISTNTDSTYVSVHIKDENGFYQIYNIVARGTQEDSLSFDVEDFYVFDTKTTLPWFAVLKPNIANNIDINSPLGISIFANAIDTLKEIDLIYDSYQNEFSLGRKRIFINVRHTTYDAASGEQYEVFDSNDVAFYVLPESDDGSQFIQDATQTLRVADHDSALQTQLNLLSYACGFGTQHYRYDAGSVSTATQIVSENSEMFRNIKKHEIIIEDALVTIVQAIIYAVNNFTNQHINEATSIEIKFDDSIIEDKQGEMANDRLDVSMGVMSKAEFRAKWYNEDLETAERKIAEMENMTIRDDDFGADETVDVTEV